MEVETKAKECQNLKDKIVKLTTQLEKCQDELKVRIKYGGSTKALNKMLSNKKYSKDTKGFRCDAGKCSTTKDSTNKEIHFVSSSDNSSRQTFTVKNVARKKIDLTTTAESLKQATSTRKNNVDSKGKGKLIKDGFIRDQNPRRSYGRSNYVVAHNTENERKLEHMNVENEHIRINNKGRRNVTSQSTRSPHIWQNKFVSHKSFLSGYCFSCKGYRHRTNECRSRCKKCPVEFFGNKNIIFNKCNAYGHKAPNCKLMHKSDPSYKRKNIFVARGNMKVICYSCNRDVHKSYECRRKTFHSSGNPSTFNNTAKGNNNGHHVRQFFAWNKTINVPRMSRNHFTPLAGHANMVLKRRASQVNRNPSTPMFSKRKVCYSCNNLGHAAKYGRTMVVKQRKMTNAYPIVSNERHGNQANLEEKVHPRR